MVGVNESTAHAYTSAVVDLLGDRAPGLLKALRERDPDFVLLDKTLAECDRADPAGPLIVFRARPGPRSLTCSAPGRIAADEESIRPGQQPVGLLGLLTPVRTGKTPGPYGKADRPGRTVSGAA